MSKPAPATPVPPDVFVLAGVWSGHAVLAPDDARHCTRVLRHQLGDVIGGIDGQGTYRSGPITEIDKLLVRFRVENEVSDWGEPARPTTLLFPPLADRDRLEWLAEKAVELGLTRLVLTETARSEAPKLNRERLERILLAALKQCHRSRLPVIEGPLPWAAALASLGSVTGFKGIAAIGAAQGLPNIQPELSNAASVTWAIGPPGDYSRAEIEAAEAAGFVAIGFGTTRLRSETAAIYALAASKAAAGA